MEDKLRLNTKLYGFDGIIGRRDFFFNAVIISAISLLFALPYTTWTMCHLEVMTDFFNPINVFLSTPLWLKCLFLAGKIGVCILAVSNIYRRLNDIIGDVKTNINAPCSAIYILASLAFLSPLWFSTIIGFANFILILVLLFKKGKITSNYPYDYRKDFNWGAFLGTWIWGLFNKSYKTLWMWLAGLTPWGMHYALYCGLKGNEWAYKNKNYTDIQEFNNSQGKQAIVFVVLTFLVLPILYFALIFGITAIIMFAAIQDAKTTPEGSQTRIEKLGCAIESMASAYFEKYEFSENENAFYVKSEDWSSYSFSDKQKIFDMAASISAQNKRKEARAKNPNDCECYSKTDELPRTKIYDSETKQLLGEYILDEKVFENGSVKDIMKAALSAYHFYNIK